MKTATAPAPSVDPSAVITVSTSWFKESPSVRGRESFSEEITSLEIFGKRGQSVNPSEKTVGSWTQRCNAAPKTTPQTMPGSPKTGSQNKIPKIIPRL